MTNKERAVQIALAVKNVQKIGIDSACQTYNLSNKTIKRIIGESVKEKTVVEGKVRFMDWCLANNVSRYIGRKFHELKGGIVIVPVSGLPAIFCDDLIYK